MSESLRDQLLKAGFAATRPEPAPRREKNRPGPRKPGKPASRPAKPGPPAQRDAAEIDLAKAWALRDRSERAQREREQREAEARARERKERRQKLATLLAGAALNAPEADRVRHFPHGGKIRRVYVTDEQLPRLNQGELALVQLGGRYLLVTRETALAAQAIDPEALVLLCDPAAAEDDDVPADLAW
jgi:uncharacterized protein YaiL (DUF2058 family)